MSGWVCRFCSAINNGGYKCRRCLAQKDDAMAFLPSSGSGRGTDG